MVPWRWWLAHGIPLGACPAGYVERVSGDAAHLVCLSPGGHLPNCRGRGFVAGSRVHLEADVEVDVAESGVCRVEDRPIEAARRLALGMRLDANTESGVGLLAVPGIGPRLAAKILAARPFASEADLTRVSGIGPKTLARLSRYLEVAGAETGQGPDLSEARRRARAPNLRPPRPRGPS